MIRETRWQDKLIILSGIIAVWLIIIFSVYGIWALFWSVPDKRAEIEYLQGRVEVLRVQVDNYQEVIEKYQAAMRFENLFLLTADHNDLMDFDALEDYLCEKRGLCKVVE